MITPRRPISDGALFVVSVSHYVAVPTEPNPDDFATTAFFFHPDGTATAPQPNLAHLFLPSNDHPRDKATFDIRFDVPAGQTAVANGVQVARGRSRAARHSVYVQRQPMATELIQLAVGNYDVTADGVHSRRLPARRDREADHGRDPAAARVTPGADRLTCRRSSGDYPFDLYGSLVVQADLGFALETQTLELIDTLVPRLHAGHVGPDAAARDVAHVVRRQRRALRVERPVAQRGPRQLVRVPLRRGPGLLEGDTEVYPGRRRATPTSTT